MLNVRGVWDLAYARTGRGRYGYRRDPDWGAWHAKQRRRVSQAFGGIDQDVLNSFLRLDPPALQHVMAAYEQRYGLSAKRYAVGAYSKWQSGDVVPSGQTLERLLEIVPPFLSFETKLRLYRSVRQAFRQAESVVVHVTDPSHIGQVAEAARRIVDRAGSQPLPAHVDARLVWLSYGDGVLARRLTAEAELAEGRISATHIEQELSTVLELLQQRDLVMTAEHAIDLPCGSILVRFSKPKRRSWWNVFRR